MIEHLEVKIPSSSAFSYPIIIGEDLFSRVSELLLDFSSSSKYLIITDQNVSDLYLKSFTNKLSKPFSLFTLVAGEESKNLNNFALICSFAAQKKIERIDTIIALGGGVVGDISGFVASTYERGINFIQVPTTLLSMVDSSIGGKVAINLPEGKNMLGTFYHPRAIITDVSTLRTLPERELKTGLAEILKYAFLAKSCNSLIDKDLIKYLQTNKENILSRDPKSMIELIRICAILKASIINQDEKEKGLRAILNLGHTFGHALENVTNYTYYTHGEAVAIGLKGAFLLSAQKKLISEEYKDEALKLLSFYNLEYKIPENISSNSIYEAMFHDKKTTHNKITFILPTAEAEVGIFSSVLKEEVIQVIDKLKR